VMFKRGADFVLVDANEALGKAKRAASKSRCKGDCGKGFCEHGRRKSRCKDCGTKKLGRAGLFGN
jgi:hypothetical protein